MKVCLISRNINNDYRGSFEFDQARALKKSGDDVYVISMDFRSIRRRRKIGLYWDIHEGINVLRCSYPLGRINRKLFYTVGKRLFERAYKEMLKRAGNIDIIHSHFLETSYITTIVLKEKLNDDTPLIVTEHSSLVNDEIEQLSGDTVSKAEYVYTKADKVIAVSEVLSAKIKSNFKTDCDVVYNVVDMEIFRFAGKKAASDEGDFIFVSAGNLLTNKRMDMLIRCFCRAFKDDRSVRLYIFGDGPMRQSLNKLVCKEKAEDRIFLMGRKTRKEISDFYKKADAFALLSEKETFGVAYVEAMSAGLPVIACYSGGPEGFITPQSGLLTRDREADIIKSLRHIRENISEYDAEDIAAYARKICSPEVIAEKLNIIYKNQLRQREG